VGSIALVRLDPSDSWMGTPLVRSSRLLMLALLLVLAATSVGRAAFEERGGESGRTDRASLEGEILRLIGATGWRASEWSILAVSLERGDTLLAIGSDRVLAPASNQKLFTTAAALHHLGPKFRFPTYLMTDGVVVEGTLHGDLILYGTGDPAMSDRLLASAEDPFREFARVLREIGIDRVAGEILGDGSYFEGPTRVESWNPQDLDDWFAAPMSALSYRENVVTLRMRPGSYPGAPVAVRTIPEGAGVPLINLGETSTAGGALLMVRAHPDDPIELRGRMRPNSPELQRDVTVSDPAAYAAAVLHYTLQTEGIVVDGGSRSLAPQEPSRLISTRLVAPAFSSSAPGTRQSPSLSAPAHLRTLAVHYSPPVEVLIGVVNKRSHNLYAEQLLIAMGRVTRGQGSFETGREALTDFLVELVGVARAEVEVVDGSGLSRLNRASANAFIQLLTYAAAAEYADLFWGSLPEAGNRQELGRMSQSAAAGNLRAKTGTINRVSALSGVVRTATGEPVLFSILSNNVPSTSLAKRLEDQIGIELAAFQREWRPAPGQLARVDFGSFGPRLLPLLGLEEE